MQNGIQDMQMFDHKNRKDYTDITFFLSEISMIKLRHFQNLERDWKS